MYDETCGEQSVSSIARHDAGGLRSARLTGATNDPQADAAAFARTFAAEYSEGGPRWLECTWQTALTRAHNQFKFLFVYLHSPQHQARLQAFLCFTALGIRA